MQDTSKQTRLRDLCLSTLLLALTFLPALPRLTAAPRLLASDPQVAGGLHLPVHPPVLRIESSPRWESERYRVLVSCGEREAFWRLSYEPEDGLGRVRNIDDSTFTSLIPWPRDLPHPQPGKPDWTDKLPFGARRAATHLFTRRRQRPAHLLCQDPMTPLGEALVGAAGDEVSAYWPRIYLAGRLPDGTLGALPFQVDVPKEMSWPWSHVIGDQIELRITVEDGGVRYRWGNQPYGPRARAAPRFSGGDVLIPADQVAAGGSGPLIPELARWLERRFPTQVGPRMGVVLTLSHRARYVDLFRAVECARGDPAVLFIVPRTPRGAFKLVLPAPKRKRDEGPLRECAEFDFGTFLIVLPNGEIRSRGEVIDADVPLRGAVLVRADRAASFETCAGLLRRAASDGGFAALAFEEEGEGIWFERLLPLPRPPKCAESMDVELPLADGAPAPEPRGRAVRIRVREGATVGEVAPDVLRLAAEGAIGFEFR